MRSAIAMGLVFSGACTGTSGPTYSGDDMLAYFPFDGERTWEFVNAEPSLTYLWVADLLQETEEVDGVTVYTVETKKDCVGNDDTCVEEEFVRSVRWSVDHTDGVAIHGYTVGTAEAVVFDPPLGIAQPRMKKEDVVETEIEGVTWTSTLALKEPCPVQWSVEWDDCLRFDIDDGDGDLSNGAPVTGNIWVITGYNVVAMSIPGEAGRWELLDHEYVE